jgi:uncharacterized protein (TIRG00374 family)
VGSALKGFLLVLASALILTAVVSFVGFEKTWVAVQQAGWLAFLSAGLLSAALLALQAGAWGVLNRAINHKVHFLTVLKAATVGLAVNICTPSTYLGGEPAKVLYVGRKTGLPYQELAGTVVLAKYLEALSFILFFAASTFIAAVGFRGVLFEGPNLPVGIALVVIAAALLILCAILWISLSNRWKPLSRLVGVLQHLHVAPQFLAKLRVRTVDMERQVAHVFCEEGRTSFRAFALFVLTHVVIFAKPAVFFLLGSQESRLLLGLGQLSLIFVACQALLAFQLTPSGAGTLDAGLIGIFALVGLGEPQCMAYLLCIRFWDAVVVGVGTVLGGHVGAGLVAGEPVPVPPPVQDPEERPWACGEEKDADDA